jgi:hypothetical protein
MTSWLPLLGNVFSYHGGGKEPDPKMLFRQEIIVEAAVKPTLLSNAPLITPATLAKSEGLLLCKVFKVLHNSSIVVAKYCPNPGWA